MAPCMEASRRPYKGRVADQATSGASALPLVIVPSRPRRPCAASGVPSASMGGIPTGT